MSSKNKKLVLVSSMVLSLIVLKHVWHSSAPEKEISPIATVRLATAKYQDISKPLIAYGQISFASDQIEQMTVQYDVLVKQVFVIPGQKVKPNEPLVKLDSSITFESTVEDAKLEVSFAEKELKRISDLRAQYLATNAEVFTAAQNLGKAQIKLNALLNQQKKGAFLNADFFGTIITVNIQAGQMIQANSALLSYSKGDDREIRLGVEVEDLPVLKNGQDVIVYSLLNEKIHQTSIIKNITGQVDQSTGLIDVVVRLSNAPRFIPGSLVRGEIITQKIKQITVPRSAVLFQKNQAYVFVLVNGKAQKRFVSVDVDNGHVVSIKQGLRVNEKVVRLGNYELKEGMRVVEQNG